MDDINQITANEIEAILLWKGEALEHKELCKILDKNEEEIASAVETLKKNLDGRGIALVETSGTIELRTNPKQSALIERLTKEELDKEIGKAGIETLAIVLYEGPIARRDIEYIRGVNSQFILRSLMVRGLVDKITAPAGRGFLYTPTTELLAHLGISSEKELPEFEAFKKEITAWRIAETEKENSGEDARLGQ